MFYALTLAILCRNIKQMYNLASRGIPGPATRF